MDLRGQGGRQGGRETVFVFLCLCVVSVGVCWWWASLDSTFFYCFVKCWVIIVWSVCPLATKGVRVCVCVFTLLPQLLSCVYESQ